MYAPVVLFVYNRMDHTRQTVEALAANHLAAESDLWVFSDGAKTDADTPLVAELREYIASIIGSAWFRSVTISESAENKGLANSIIQGVTKVLAQSQRVVVLEDDLITAPDFLNFMNDCLEFYRELPVGAISAYSPISNMPDEYAESVYVSKRSCSHGWATWSDRWRGVDWDVLNFEKFRQSSAMRREFDSTGADRFDRLRRQVEGGIDSWSVRFGFHLFMHNLVIVYPATNRISNIGFDGSGVHTKADHRDGFETSISLKSVSYKLSYPPEDPEITRMFFKLYSGTQLRIIARKMRNSKVMTTIRNVAKNLN